MADMNEKSIKDLEKVAARIRSRLVNMSYDSRASHLGSALSCVDILVVLYWNILKLNSRNINLPDRDRFILSKGHAIAALYAVLAARGLMDASRLKTFCAPGSDLAEHPVPFQPAGVEAATGSLGHGLSMGVGMALAGKIQAIAYNVFVLVSDGECNEGSLWEAAMYAPKQKLGNFTVIVDFNKWQATGRSCDVSGIDPLPQKWEAFGWKVFETDGHDMQSICSVMQEAYEYTEGPTAVIAHTVKGKGVSFMEDDNNWHYRIPNCEEVLLAEKELGYLIKNHEQGNNR